jgi:DNA modification methylase
MTNDNIDKLGPYDLNTIVTGDARQLVEAVPDGSVDLVFTDPPFGTGTYDTDIPVHPKTWQEIRRIGKNLFAIWGYPKNLFEWSKYFNNLALLEYIVWYKYNEHVVSIGLTKVHQDIAIWGISKKQIFVDKVRLPYTDNIAARKWFGRGNGQLTGRTKNNKPNQKGKRCDDVWCIPAPHALFHGKKRLHKNEKPEEAAKRIILLLTKPGDIVCDPFCGSGTIPAACKLLDRGFLGFELDKKMAEIARRRIEYTQTPLPTINEQLSNDDKPKQLNMLLKVDSNDES